MDAKAVKASLEYEIYAPNHNSFFTDLLGPVRSIDVVSKFVLRLNLKTPNADLPYLFAFAGESVIGPKMVADLAANPQSSTYSTRSDGAGPYMIDHAHTVLGTRCTFVPNPYYYDKSQQHWSKIVNVNITDPNAILAALKTGQVAAANGDPSTAADAAAAGFSVSVAPQQHFYGLSFLDRGGHLNKALGDLRVRRALNYAIDRKTIAAALFGKYAQPTSQAITASDGSDPKLANAYPYNPAKAKALLAAAGYPNGFTLKTVGAGAWLDSQKGNAMTQAICKYLAAVKVSCQIDQTPGYPQYADEMGSENSTFEAGICPCGFALTSFNYTQFLKPGGLQPQHGWTDPVSNKLWLTLIRSDPEAANKVSHQLVARWTDQAYMLPVLVADSLVYYNPKIVTGAAGSNNVSGTWAWFEVVSEWSPAK